MTEIGAGTVPAARIGPPGAAAPVDPRLEPILELMETTPTGRPLAERLRADGMPVTVMSDDAYAAEHGNSGGTFDPQTGHIYIPDSLTRALPQAGAMTLAHEATHYVDFTNGADNQRDWGEFPQEVGKAFRHTWNPLTALWDGIARLARSPEPAAYRIEAQIAHEMDLNFAPGGTIGDIQNGILPTDDDILHRLVEDDLYSLPIGLRLGVGVPLAAVGAWVGHALLARAFRGRAVAPHPAVLVAIPAALAVTAVAADTVTALRRR